LNLVGACSFTVHHHQIGNLVRNPDKQQAASSSAWYTGGTNSHNCMF